MSQIGNGNGYHKNGINGTVNGLGSRSVINGILSDRLPPQNLEAEQGVLGSILMDDSQFGPVYKILSADDFYRDSHQLIFRTMIEMSVAGIPIDMITLEEWLKRRDRLEKVGGMDALFQILNCVPHAVSAVYYAQIVRQKSIARDLIEHAHLTLTEGYGDQHTAEELLAKSQSRLARIVSREASTIESEDEQPIEVATAADIRRMVGESRWLWPGWIIDAQMTVLAAEPATGKTRLTLDLCRRMWNCEPWPDTTEATRPMNTSSFWVASDRNHGEIVRAMEDFGLPNESVFFNASPTDPFGGVKLDDPAEIRAMRRRIKSCRPGLIVIDTINKATKRILYRPEEADAFFGPLLEIARDMQIPILALTHLSRSGDPLDRRIEGTCRVLLKMARPEGDETSTRRRLWVAAIREGKPSAPLGVSMGDNGNDYDGQPPTREEIDAKPGTQGRPAKAVKAAMDWLKDYLAEGPVYCRKAIENGIEAGHGRRTLFKAAAELGVITGGTKGEKFYRLPNPGEASDPASEGEADEEGPEE